MLFAGSSLAAREPASAKERRQASTAADTSRIEPEEVAPVKSTGKPSILALAFASLLTAAPIVPAQDLTVIRGGRVMDPESGVDSVRNIGIAEGRIVALTDGDIAGGEIVEAQGLVVAPGFIDLHAHGQDPVSRTLQLQDGVTTALELEIGVYPVAEWLADQEGASPIHYGASVGHLGARVMLFHQTGIGSWATLSPDRTDLIEFSDFEQKDTSASERRRLLELMTTGLDEGGLGFGLGITYTPGASRSEIFEIFQVAASHRVPLFVHVRGRNSGGTLGAFQECLANAAATGASLHFVHLNSSGGELAPTVLELIRGARGRGVDVSTEAYPYTAGSTRIESASFDNWESRPDAYFERTQWAATGERLTRESFGRYREEGGWVITHGRREETNRWIVAQADVMVASDGIPFLYGPAHPRGAGTFSRVLGHYVREENALSLMAALAKMTLLPARRLEAMAPAMRNKGRIRLGADADLTIFDPESILDQSTYEKGDVPSQGIRHVFVSGVHMVDDGVVETTMFPGTPIVSEPARQ